LIAQL